MNALGWILIFSIVAAVVIVFGLALSGHLDIGIWSERQKYVLPMIQFGILDTLIHIDTIPVYEENPRYFGHISHITLLEDESIRVRFEGDQELLPWGYYPPFTYEETYQIGDSFAALCIKSENRTSFSLYEYNGTI